jgi:hypothetical protein
MDNFMCHGKKERKRRRLTIIIIRNGAKTISPYDNLSSVSQNVLKFYQQLTGEERRVPFIFGLNNQ